MTEPDQRDKDPEPAGKWVNVRTMIPVNPDRSPRSGEDPDVEWEEALVEQQEELPGVELEEEPGKARAEIPSKTKSPEHI